MSNTTADVEYFDLGAHSRPITTVSADAQTWFDRGLMWLYGFNFDEATACFERVIAADPGAVMGYWGIAYAIGSNYNKQWKHFAGGEIPEVLDRVADVLFAGTRHLEAVSPVERDLFSSLRVRYQDTGDIDPDVLCTWNDDYADAMREVHRRHPDDWDVATLFADALMNRTPWQLWDLAARTPAEGADTDEAIAVLERGMEQVSNSDAPPHPGLLHLHVHVMEMSPHPERALPAADILRTLVPDTGHLLHMPSHIDILLGHYHDAVEANERAHEANNRYAARMGDVNQYTFYRAHDIHFRIYAAMLLGRFEAALAAAEQMQQLAHDDLLRVERPPMAMSLEGMVTMKLHVLIRFGKWEAVLDEPFPDDAELYCNTVAMLHYARGVAHAALGDHEAADRERAAFADAKRKVVEDRYIFNNTCIDILEVAQAMLDGEVEYHRGNHDAAFDHLRHAVHLDDHLAYAEPWGWMMPTRHALGALLLEQGRVDEALAVYAADLGFDDSIYRPMQHPDNIWALTGYIDCLIRLERRDEAAAMQPRLDDARARADVEVTTSCFCAGRSVDVESPDRRP